MTAKLPDGNYLPLITINDWDVNWQGTYQFAKPIRLPKGTVVCLHAVYDNSAGNPLNPNDPPREVRWGEQTTDEMCLCGLQVYTDRPADLQQIAKMPGYELAVGLEGGIPGLAEQIQREQQRRASRTTRHGAAAFPPEGIPIFADRVDQLLRYDRDRNGYLNARRNLADGPAHANVRAQALFRPAVEKGDILLFRSSKWGHSTF